MIGVRSGFADVGSAAAEEIEGTAAIGSLIGVPRDDGGDGLERDTQFVGNNLAICRECGALTKVTLAGSNEDGVIRMYFDPGTKLSWIERVLEGSSGDFGTPEILSFEERRTDERDADNKCAARFDELTAGESSLMNLDGVFSGGSHGLFPLSH